MFTKTAKRVISLILCVLMFVPFMTMAGAVVEVETQELVNARGNFEQGEGPKASGYVTQYQFYSPVRGTTNNTTKYPVVFFIGKTRNTSSTGAELRETSFPLWSTKKYQDRFYGTNGAYLVLTRPQPLEDKLGGIFGSAFENESSVRASLKAMIEDFILKNEANVDKSRIYIVAWDEGCKLAIRLAAEENSPVAALVIASPNYMPTSEEFTNMANVPTWLLGCEKDTVVDYDIRAYWDGLKNGTGERIRTRFTSFESFNTKGDAHHDTWEYVAYDTNYTGTHKGAKTVNGEDKVLNVGGEDSIIAWMSKIGSDYGSDCTCPCHGTDDLLESIKWFFKWMISMMLKIEKNQECACGKMHW